MINKTTLFFYITSLTLVQLFAQSYTEQFHKAEQEFATGAKSNAASLYNKAGYAAWDAKDFNTAITSFTKSLEINKEQGNHNGIKVLLNNIGDIYFDQKNYSKADEIYSSGLSHFTQINDKKGQANFFKKLGELAFEQNNHGEAILNLEKALSLANETKDENNIRNCHRILSEVYKANRDTQKAFEHFEKYRALLTKMQQEQQAHVQKNTNNKLAAAEIEKAKMAAENDKIASEKALTEANLHIAKDSLEKAEAKALLQQEHIEKLEVEKQLSDLQDKNRQLIIDIIIIVLVFIIGFTAYVIIVLKKTKRKNVILNQQKEEITSQHKEIETKTIELEKAYSDIHDKNYKIESSINYAQRIQESMLPEKDKLDQFFDDSFIIFRPKDVVSGDFYWFDNPRTGLGDVRRDRNKLVLAAVDCTGHGVPGAFMSMIGYNALQNINGTGINQADLILNELHSRIRYNILKQDKNNNKDGMDLALTIVDKKERKIQFAGAHNPIVYIQNGELFQIKGDKFPIGGVQREDQRIFQMHEIDASVPTYCYLFSDGFQDQFGGPQGRKFMIKRMKQMFLDNHTKPFEEQKKIYQCALDQWMRTEDKEHKQIDDILVIGFKL